jgi:hypothetical protein
MTRIGIPLFDGFTYNIIDDSDPNFANSLTAPKCFGYAESLKINFLFLIFSLFMFLFF